MPPSDPPARSAPDPANAPRPEINVDRYEFLDLLGKGGMGSVWAAMDGDVRREVAIKVLHGPASDDQIARFVHEGQVTGQLEHPNIVPVHDVGMDPDGRLYMSMKLVRGQSLAELIADAYTAVRRGQPCPVPLTQRIEIFRKVLDAVDYAHSRGVIHRDLKPANIMVGAFGEVLVMDWGIARVQAPGDDSAAAVSTSERGDAPMAAPEGARPIAPVRPSTTVRDNLPVTLPAAPRARPRPGTSRRGQVVPTMADHGPSTVQTDRKEMDAGLTADGVAMGTPGYFAIEQARGLHDVVDERSDIYALGAILYELVTLTPAYDGSPMQRISAQMDGLPEPARRRISSTFPVARDLDAPVELDAIARRCMAGRQAHRYQTVAALRDDIEAFSSWGAVTAHRDGVLRRASKWVRRHPTTTVAAALVLLALSITAVALQQIAEAQARIDRESRQRSEEQAARRQAELEAAAREADARLAKAAEAAARGELAEVRRLVRSDAVTEREEVVREFRRLWREKEARHQSDEEFARNLGPERIREFLAAFDRLIDEVAPATGLQLTASDYFQRAFIGSHLPGHDLRKTVADYDRALELEPDFVPAIVNRGSIHRSLGNHEQALADANRAIELEPDDATAWYNRGNLLGDANDAAGAIAAFNEAIRLEPGYAQAFNNRAIAQLTLGDLQGALADLEQAVKLAPALTVAWDNLGNVRRDLGDTDGALQAYTRTIELDPDFVTGWANRGILRIKLGHPQEGIPDLDRAIQLEPANHHLLVARAQARSATGDDRGAFEDMSRVVELQPDYADAWVDRARVRRELGDLPGAIADLERSLELAPRSASAWFTLANTRRDVGNTAGAMEAYGRALDIDPSNGRVWVNRALVRSSTGDESGALADLRRATEVSPRLWQAWFNLAHTLESTAPGEAIRAYQQAYRCCGIPAKRDNIASRLRQLGGTVPD